MSSAYEERRLRRADPSTIQDKFMVGYQGWFTCAGDGEPVGPGHHGWLHWFNYPIPDGGRPNTDLWPDISEYSPSELYPAPGLKHADGSQAFLFSSRNPKTVQRHFHWMARHGVDGAFLQRFLGQCDVERGNEGIRRQRDEVGDRVKEAAEKEGRVFAIMYDVSGVPLDRIEPVIKQDWVHLIRDKGILDSPNYLREKGKPVIALWGFGFSDRNHSPAMVRSVLSYLRSVTPGGAYIFGGVPAHWRTSVSDADPNPEFLNLWLEEFDALSPWTIGRYGNEDDADRFAEEKIKSDVELLKKRADEGHKKVDYIPVILPGGSGYNLSEGKWGFNDIKRNGGRFLWRQLWNVRRHGVRTIYGAMWDEYDEGTAYMPVVSHKKQLPVHDKFRFMALDEDGHDLPSDWYMRICGLAADGLRGERMIHETFPYKELQDYWSTHPKYDEGEKGPSAASSGNSQNWMSSQDSKVDDEPPPPPYSLAAGSSAAGSSSLQEVSRPPELPLSTRPLFVHKHHGSTAAAGPPLPQGTRPTSSGSSRPPVNFGKRPTSTSSVSQITEDLSRHSISHSPPRPPIPSSTRPLSPSANGPHLEPAVSLPVPDLHASSVRPGSVDPGFAPSLSSQPQWPPPEWNVPSSPHSPASSSYRVSYQPEYAPPPLRPRPSSHEHAPMHEPGFRPLTPPQGSSYDPSTSTFMFPQAQSSNNYYSSGGTQSQQRPHQGYESFGPQHGHGPPPLPADPTCAASDYAPPPSHLPSPQHHTHTTPPASCTSPNAPYLSSGPLRYAVNAVDRVAGQGTGRQIERGVGSIAQKGSKILAKLTK
ncbi:hypothetical protein NEOLEDRAFT_1246545 [Neolentinus lepideus HHB14362 ss-1]|uniref:Xylosidase/arabinosidase n=1 Tax=Neolentinus lepideus HHB14362 ss-1 TaxID=1314782 RepID=A0A165ME00_9AGAM|nr:hypothetical protein NEOLEDRAFT_1246545 [Neolentinus lepideus HHB14362 ss-1]